jgi:hypothetical protein
VASNPDSLTGGGTTLNSAIVVYPPDNLAFVPEVYGIIARSYTFNTGYLNLKGFYTHYNSYPYNSLACNSVSRAFITFPDPTYYEYTYNTGTKTITFTPPTATNC